MNKRVLSKKCMPLVQPQKTRGAAAKITRGATAPFEPPFPTPPVLAEASTASSYL